MSRRVKIIAIVVAIAVLLGIIGGTVYAAGVGRGGPCALWDSACGQALGDRSGCCGDNGGGLQDGSCH